MYFEENYDRLRLPVAVTGHTGIRPAQIAAAHALSAHFFAKTDPAIVVMPTGSGKTCVMVLAAFLLRCRRVLVITPSRMVRDQLGEHFATLHLLKTLGALDKGVELPRVQKIEGQLRKASDWKKLEKKDVAISTVQSASPFLKGIAEPPKDLFDLVLVDEAHHSPAPSWRALLDCFPDAKRALFTATPFRRDERTIGGRLVFEYTLARAREDGVFGRIQYEPVALPNGADADLTLAKATEARLKADERAGHRHLVMVRTSQRTRAEELAKLYAKKTKLRLATVFGTHTQKHVRSVLKKLVDGDLDGVICVDMLGEGFDLPSLKIAALHSPHRSLAVTLQFIGRFARTTATNTGKATFLAIPSEIETEAEHLFRVGAEWNEIVEEASRKRIDAEREARDVVATFVKTDFFTESPAGRDEEIDLRDIAPRFHVKILSVPKGVDLDQELDLPTPGEPILVRRSEEHQAVICITKHVAPCRWSKDDRIANVHYDLFVLYFDDKTKLLFIGSTRREVAVYDAIVEAVAQGQPRLLAPLELNRVLRGLHQPQFFSVGMRKRSGREESYRTIAGPSADRVIQKSDGRFYESGHCYGKGTEAGSNVTIGFSSASKVWSAENGALAAFFKWCRKIGLKINDTSAVTTGSGLDFLPLASQVTEFPDHLIAIDWNERLYMAGGHTLRSLRTSGKHWDASFHDCDLRIDSTAKTELRFAIVTPREEIGVVYRLGAGLRRFAIDKDSASHVLIDADGAVTNLEDALNEWPPALYTATLERLQGDRLSGAPSTSNFDLTSIEVVDWAAANADPLLEKPDGSGRSLFDWLQQRLQSSSVPVIFNDDGSGEAADFVTLASLGNRTEVHLYHCKAAARNPVPGRRVEDLYEVVGQAVKCSKLTLPGVLRDHLKWRGGRRPQRFVRGTLADVDALLAASVSTSFRVVIVQPGIGDRLTTDQDTILAAAHSYLFGANVTGLSIIGARAEPRPT